MPDRPGPFPEAVGRFLHGCAALEVEGLDETVAAEDAWRLAVGVLSADGHLSLPETDALATAFPDRNPTPFPDRRSTGAPDAGADSLETFARLAQADAADGGQRAWRYYADAMALAHAAVAIDVVPRGAQLAAVDRLRNRMLGIIAERGLARPTPRELSGGLSRDAAMWLPWQPAPAAASPAASPAASTVTSTAAATVAPTPPRPVGEVLADLDSLIGLDAVKTQVRRVTDLATVHRLRRERGLPVPPTTHHLVFTGNPGTGKTTVARLIAEIYAALGVVERGQLIETDRSGLVVGYVGQTATRVREVVETALGGVLLIDEAYALARGGDRDFGREAIDTLVKLMEDHRNDLVVIVAGYPEEMKELLASNPGLASRFPRTITFPNYDDAELVSILVQIAADNTYELDAGARKAAHDWFAVQPRGPGFGNGRLARNLFEEAIGRQATRLVAADEGAGDGRPSAEQLTTLTRADLPAPGEPLAAAVRPEVNH